MKVGMKVGMKVACAMGATGAALFVVSLLRLTIVLYCHTYKQILTEWVGWLEYLFSHLSSLSFLFFSSSLCLFVP